jgi:hypothetical protein
VSALEDRIADERDRELAHRRRWLTFAALQDTHGDFICDEHGPVAPMPVAVTAPGQAPTSGGHRLALQGTLYAAGWILVWTGLVGIYGLPSALVAITVAAATVAAIDVIKNWKGLGHGEGARGEKSHNGRVR